ncbi:sensor histidine kinase [Methanobacterium subterraneum]|uniref:Sensor histidine kinase n=1 Tax=Methanobacterium subterraneum TaxID=59277 RepID=A0A7K4DIZ1_9EURY|nr:sensor histidine kinase [Methanobacterium subterraneum]NMO08268.1 sensor histidine kinase [Methanobacterium subterraneum]
MPQSAVEAFGLSCDFNGKIIEILYDNLGIDSFKTGKPFPNILDEGSTEKALDFIKKIKEEDAVHDWEFNLGFRGKLIIIHVSGLLVNHNILIFGAKTVDDAFYFMENMARINNEQTNALRGVIKYFTAHLHEQEAKESQIYAELGRLNNELTNAQRELTKKNIQLTKLNQQKEMLIKEVHHRVKNNLMIISSLLNLQSNYLKDEESKEIFKESQNRAKSMALIHERLYRSADLKNIDFKEYITTLANDLYRTYVKDPSRVALELNIQDVNIDINAAIPLGLILNELITNSMKHAFPNGKDGAVSISFGKNDDEFILKVSDDGIGFPSDLDYTKTNSLGMQLVNSLTNQINGKIELDKDHGTKFTITFKELGL